MITQNLKKLKKYLFLISIMFFVLTLSHLTYKYLYNDAKDLPVKGGTISEGIVGSFPSLNPLIPMSDGNDRYILKLLYRSLLKYDISQQKILGDIASCDISSLINISCIINENVKWSTGEDLTAEDILATYQLIRETGSNPVLVSLLQDTEIEAKGNVLVFKNTRKDVNFLNVFLQPILKKSFIDTLTTENITGNFPTTTGIYSGQFIIEKISEDESLGISKITLTKNEYNDTSNISKIILNVFPDINSLKKNYAAVNVYNDNDNTIGNSISKFESYNYTLNSFVSLFLNAEKINNTELRTYILNKIDSSKLLNILGNNYYTEVKNPYLSDVSIAKENPANKNFDTIMASLGYKKKSAISTEVLPKLEEKIKNNSGSTENSGENSTNTEENNTSNNVEIPADLSLDRYQKNSATIYSPDYVDIYNFITKDDILLKGNNPKNVEAVYVNDYKLSGFKPGLGEFYYRLKESYGNLNAGVNTYKIYFEIGGEKQLQEELTFVYYHDKELLKEEEKKLVERLYKEEKESKVTETPVVEENKKEEKPKQDENQEPTISKEDQELIDKINNLDEYLYYDKDYNPFSLKLYYLDDGKKETIDTVKFIETSLKEIGITVISTPFSLQEVTTIFSNKDTYDMLLTGVHLGYLNFNIFPYLHSSQAKSGYNFSNFRKPSLDILLEELKENIYTEEKTEKIKQKVLDILKEEQILKTLYNPKVNLLIDKSIKVDQTYNFLPYKGERNEILENAYIKKEKIADFSDKNVSGFFKYLFKSLVSFGENKETNSGNTEENSLEENSGNLETNSGNLAE